MVMLLVHDLNGAIEIKLFSIVELCWPLALGVLE